MATSLQPVKSWKKIGRTCEGADFSWLSSKVSQTLGRVPMQVRAGRPGNEGGVGGAESNDRENQQMLQMNRLNARNNWLKFKTA
jgi:hypothetical protein